MLADLDDCIERVADRICGCGNLCCLSGAGISAESGVPTFRGQDGFWERHRAEDLATPQAFERDPKLVWQFYNYRRNLLRDCRPNPAHDALVALEALFPRWSLITQNVDGLHQQAGSRQVIELHGNIWTVRCVRCGRQRESRGMALNDLPRCDVCPGLLRPGVVWFGEALPGPALQAAEQAVVICEAMLVVGTSSAVQPAASMAYWAKSHGALVVEVNLEQTPLSSDADHILRGPAATVLPRLAERLRRKT